MLPPPCQAGWHPDARLVHELGAPAVVLDADLQVLHTNAALTALGAATDAAPVLSPPDAGAVREVVALVLAGSTWTGELDLGLDGVTGGTTWWTPVWRSGEIAGALAVLSRSAAEHLSSDDFTDRLGQLAFITSELLVARDVATVTELVVHQVTDAAGATIGSLSVRLDDDTMGLTALRGAAAGAEERWAVYPVAGNTPAAESVRTGRRVLAQGHAEIQRRYPGLESAAPGERTLLCLPLTVATATIGVISLSFPGLREIDPTEDLFLRVLADTCAQTLDRLRQEERSVDRERKLRFLAEASAKLAGDLDYETTLAAVAELAIPWFADWCAIALESDGLLRTLSVAHSRPEHIELVERLQRDFPADPREERGSYGVLRSGESQLVPDVSDELLVASAQSEEHLRLLRILEFRSGLSVPLKSGDRVLGVISWVTGRGGRRFTEDDRAFGEDLALRAAVAIDNAQLHSQLRDSAVKLQQAVLPQQLPDLPAWETAVQYRAAGRSGVGGDFYDVVPLDDDRIAFFVGDVMGRGVEATTVMAQIGSAIRTLVAINPDPEVVMIGLDRVVESWHVDQLVTVVYGVADSARDTVRIINAGHPEPIRVPTGGAAELISTPSTLILGVGGGHRLAVTRPFAVGDSLLLFTDGLVEHRHEDLHVSLTRLLERVEQVRGCPDLDAAVARLVDEVGDPTRDDDVAALVLRRR